MFYFAQHTYLTLMALFKYYQMCNAINKFCKTIELISLNVKPTNVGHLQSEFVLNQMCLLQTNVLTHALKIIHRGDWAGNRIISQINSTSFYFVFFSIPTIKISILTICKFCSDSKKRTLCLMSLFDSPREAKYVYLRIAVL